MRQFIVTVIDTVGIQSYIFGSNSLQHNVGASALVHWATHDWVYKALVGLGTTNVNTRGEFNGKRIETVDLASELVYAGGGNTVILFQNDDLATRFTQQLTSQVLLGAPGLQLVIVHNNFDWEREALAAKVRDTLGKANAKKADRACSTPILGLGVTADCQYTGLPASELRHEPGGGTRQIRISSEVAAKWNAGPSANERLHKVVGDAAGFDFVYDFDEFGQKGESSYIAVIHTDGNNMSKRVQAIADAHPSSEDNRSYIEAIRAFSKSVEDATENALKASVGQLLTSRQDGKIGGKVEIRNNRLPFRPIVFGGDDVTFVCDGRLGLTLTEFYLRQLTTYPLTDCKPIYAKAGISVVKSHYPFARAYALAEELTKSAKEYINERQKPPFSDRDLSAIDWHFAVSGLVLNLEEIRRRHYTVQSGHLNMRPLRLGKSTDADWRSWETFTRIISQFRGEEWAGKRNKIKALRQALRAGPEAVEQFVMAYEPHRLPGIPGVPDSARQGWVGERCTCFDAIEGLDFFVSLDGGGK